MELLLTLLGIAYLVLAIMLFIFIRVENRELGYDKVAAWEVFLPLVWPVWLLWYGVSKVLK